MDYHWQPNVVVHHKDGACFANPGRGSVAFCDLFTLQGPRDSRGYVGLFDFGEPKTTRFM